MKKDDFAHFWAPLISVTILLIIIAFSAPCCFGCEIEPDDIDPGAWAREIKLDVPFYRELVFQMDMVRVYETDELKQHLDELYTRSETGLIIIEVIIGVCLDWEGNGQILNTEDKYYNYIHYDTSVPTETGKQIVPGSVVLTHCLYNPDTNGEDDVLIRFDDILDDTQLVDEDE